MEPQNASEKTKIESLHRYMGISNPSHLQTSRALKDLISLALPPKDESDS